MSYVLTGQCHCGNLFVRFTSTKPPTELTSRACACSFCKPRRTRWTSDPEGRAKVVIADVRELSRYSFGTGTADFLICRRCGYVVAAVGHDEPQRAVVNLNVLEQSSSFPDAIATDYEGEIVEERLARRARTWMPVTVIVRK